MSTIENEEVEDIQTDNIAHQRIEGIHQYDVDQVNISANNLFRAEEIRIDMEDENKPQLAQIWTALTTNSQAVAFIKHMNENMKLSFDPFTCRINCTPTPRNLNAWMNGLSFFTGTNNIISQ
jgi:hypothetical protein